MKIIYLYLITTFYTLVITASIVESTVYLTEQNNCPVDFCNSTLPSKCAVKDYCLKTASENHFDGRCCIQDDTNIIVGLDLSSCDLKNFNVSNTNFTELVILDLRDNEINSLVPQDFTGLLNLTYLYLPYWIPCPGGKEAWNETHMNETYCYLQKDPCVYLNISCTDNGDCIHKGPGYAKCVCKPGHYGYKCMNEGEFPATTFSISITVSTVVLSIILWFAHGRDAYKKR